MPIAINGTGTITGITAGGLPDGIITRSEIGYSGAILQVVQATTEDTANYASVNFQQTAVNVSITPASSTSKFLIRTILQGGVLTWLDDTLPRPSDAEIQTEIIRLQDQYEATKYRRERQKNYPPITELADALYWASEGDESKLTAYYAACAAVKAKYPKPEVTS